MTDDATGLTRRRLLTRGGVAVAAAVSTAGCLGSGFDPFGRESGIQLRARTATGTETDTKCELSNEFVGAHPALETVLTEAERTSSEEWASNRLSLEEGESLGDALQNHCAGETRGLYRYGGDWYFVSLRYEDPSDHDHGGGGGSETHHHEDGDGDSHHHERTAGGPATET